LSQLLAGGLQRFGELLVLSPQPMIGQPQFAGGGRRLIGRILRSHATNPTEAPAAQDLPVGLAQRLPGSAPREPYSGRSNAAPDVAAAGRSPRQPGGGPRRGTRCVRSCGALVGSPGPPPSIRAPATPMRAAQ